MHAAAATSQTALIGSPRTVAIMPRATAAVTATSAHKTFFPKLILCSFYCKSACSSELTTSQSAPGVPEGSRQKAEGGRQEAEGRRRRAESRKQKAVGSRAPSAFWFLLSAYCVLLHAVPTDQPLDALRNRRVGGKQTRENLARSQRLADE